MSSKKKKVVDESSVEEMAMAIIHIIERSDLNGKRQIMMDLLNNNEELYFEVYGNLTESEITHILQSV